MALGVAETDAAALSTDSVHLDILPVKLTLGSAPVRVAGMRAVFDQFAKVVATSLLRMLGSAESQVEVPSRVQYIDVCFRPEPKSDSEILRARMGLFGRIAETACVIEFFQKPPSADDVFDCINKQRQYAAGLTAAKTTAEISAVTDGDHPAEPRSERARLWILSAGEPRRLLEQLTFKPMEGWPEGFWQLADEAYDVCLIILSKLEETPETTILRLFGALPTLQRVARELLAKSPESWERKLVEPIVLALGLKTGTHSGADDRSWYEDLMAQIPEFQQFVDDWAAKLRGEGHLEGRKEGRKEGLLDGIYAMCDKSGISLSASQRMELRTADVARLKSILDALRSSNQWPGV